MMSNFSCISAFRGFGGPQGLFGCETVVEHVAHYLKLDPSIVRHLNLYQEGDLTHFSQPLERWNIPRILDELQISSSFLQRQKRVEEFNELHAYRKRGICLLPTKYGIAFTAKFLHQAAALIHIYKDGSVLLSHGGNFLFGPDKCDSIGSFFVGTEMGQGLHTKMICIAAEILRCDANRIHVSETSTDKVANTSPTAASVSSDMNGMAVRDACKKVRDRMDKLVTDTNSAELSWENLVQLAYFSRIDLCAHGYHATPGPLGVDFTKNQAYFVYFTQGAAVTEVELDTLTGDWHILRADILMVDACL